MISAPYRKETSTAFRSEASSTAQRDLGRSNVPRNKVGGENGNGDVVLLHRIVIVLAGEGDLVLRGGELFLEGEEILVGLQVGVVFRHGQKGLERPGELVLQRGGFFQWWR
jgi:hypothetical protein